MAISFAGRVLASLAVLALTTPIAALADHDHDDWRRNQYRNNQKVQKRIIQSQRKAYKKYSQDHWNTHWGNNWNDQRSWYSYNMRNRMNARRADDRQRQLEAQLRAQYLAYNNNNYNGAYGWNQYSDPNFLNYVHGRNPSLLNSIRSIVGF